MALVPLGASVVLLMIVLTFFDDGTEEEGGALLCLDDLESGGRGGGDGGDGGDGGGSPPPGSGACSVGSQSMCSVAPCSYLDLVGWLGSPPPWYVDYNSTDSCAPLYRPSELGGEWSVKATHTGGAHLCMLLCVPV